MLDKVQKEFVKAIERYAKQYKTTTDKVQISMSLRILDDEDGTAYPRYRVLVNYAPMQEVTMKEIRGGGMDILGLNNMADGIICNKLAEKAEEYGIAYENISAMALAVPDPEDEDEKNIIFWVYDGGTAKKKLSLNELLS